MSYTYSNPYAPAPSQPLRSTFSAGVGGQRYKVLFSGLPPDVTEKDLRDILLQQPLSLPATATFFQCFFDQNKQFTGNAIVEVGNEIDAERIRREYSGQVIDGTYQLLVHHVLSPTQTRPSASEIPSFPADPTPAPRQQAPSAPKAAQKPSQTNNKAAKPAPNEKAPGLKLLARLTKPGAGGKPASKEQLALLARQKANIKGKTKDNLLSRLANDKPGPAGKSAKAKTAKVAAGGGGAKVGRAKKNAAKDKMDVDPEPKKQQQQQQAKPQKAKPKTQAELDAEMAMWERQRRFAA